MPRVQGNVSTHRLSATSAREHDPTLQSILNRNEQKLAKKKYFRPSKSEVSMALPSLHNFRQSLAARRVSTLARFLVPGDVSSFTFRPHPTRTQQSNQSILSVWCMDSLYASFQAFGSPTIAVEGSDGKTHMVFGSDRLEVVAHLLGELFKLHLAHW